MVNLDSFEQYLVGQTIHIDYSYLILALITAIILGAILAKIYTHCAFSISNRKKFSSIFVLLISITTVIIMIVKSSLALSLGLVGALSIVRFRAAIKEPEELVFLFLCISIGLGLGAGQLQITLVAYAIIVLYILGRHFFSLKKDKNHNLYLTIIGKDIELKDIVKILNKNCSSVHLKRFDKLENKTIEAAFMVDFPSFNKLENTKEDLNKLSKDICFTYLDKNGLF